MGKIVKYCSSCDEGFAAKFAFCPDCGQPLEAFEMNPVGQEASPVEAAAPAAETVAPAIPVAQNADLLEIPDQPAVNAAPETEIAPVEEPIIDVAEPIAEVSEPVVEAAPAEAEPVIETAPQPVTETLAAAIPAASAANVFFQTTPVDADRKPASFEAEHEAYNAEGAFYVTVIEEKNVKQRNGLLLGAFCLILLSLMGGLVYNIFSKDLDVAALNDDTFMASLIDADVPAVEEEQRKNEESGGGGGGGGKEEKERASQGDPPDQSKNPVKPPDERAFKADFELKTPPGETQGNQKYDRRFDHQGLLNGNAGVSNGTGRGGGIGDGLGLGAGNGNGSGNGNGNGSGSGNGNGNGNGNGSGNGNGEAPPPPKAVGPTSPLKILFKPRARYTDAARQQNIQGTVTLRVTFLASGQIGSISAVKGLPAGLTEEAIAAARSIRFEPQKIGGVPQTTTKTMEISFAIY